MTQYYMYYMAAYVPPEERIPEFQKWVDECLVKRAYNPACGFSYSVSLDEMIWILNELSVLSRESAR